MWYLLLGEDLRYRRDGDGSKQEHESDILVQILLWARQTTSKLSGFCLLHMQLRVLIAALEIMDSHQNAFIES